MNGNTNNSRDVIAKNIPRMSDVGSRKSYISKRGIPRTIWQKGAMFSNK